MPTCSLCDLALPETPVTDPDDPGAYCCRGCLAVATQLDGADASDAGTERPAIQSEPDADADGETAYLAVEGMHCASCETYLEAIATQEEGVTGAAASYAAELLRVTYDPAELDQHDLADLVDGMGYRGRLIDEPPAKGSDPPWRLIVGALAGMMVMGWYVVFLYPRYLGVAPADPAWTGGTALVSLVNVWLFTSIVLGYTGRPILEGAYVSLRTREPNMDLLVTLAASTAYLYSTIAMGLGRTELYFDITVVVILVVTLGNAYEKRIKRRASGLLASVTTARVQRARRRSDSGLETVDVAALDPGDEVVVSDGERVPVDGTVIEGSAAVDAALVTGESLPERHAEGDEIVGGATVVDGSLVVTVGPEAESTLDRLVDMLWRIQSQRSGVQRLADRIAAVFVPLVLLLAVLATAVHLVLGATATAAFLTGLTVLIVSCPCALGLATPLAMASGLRAALDRGIVVRDATVFERAPAADVVVFDKTGTLTTGEMMVDAVHGDENGLALAAAVEAHSSHPVAGAIETAASHGDAAAATAADGGAPAATAVDHHPGAGVVGRVADRRVAVGSQRLVQLEDLAVPEALAARAEDAMAAGNLPVYVGWAGDVKTVIVVRDAPRSNWEAVVTALAAGAREVLVMTGDDRRAVARFEAHEGIDEVFADVRPEAKAAVVEGLRERGTVAMVGDGSNDAPALATADLGIALGSGTALASDAADVVVTSGLAGVPRVFDLATAARRRMRSNLGWAFLYNAVAVPVAAAGLLNPLVAAVAMASSSLLVVTNSARAYAVDGGSEQAAGGDADASDRRTHTQDSPPGRDAPRPE